MANPFVAEIRIFPFNFAPVGWAMCNGQLLPISQNTALFSLLGTTYGGNGVSNFALPNLQGAAPMAPGQGPGLSDYDLGQSGGTQTVTLSETELASHSHTAGCNSGPGPQSSPAGGVWASLGGQRATPLLKTGPVVSRTPPACYSDAAPSVQMSGSALGPTGESQPHNNLQPYLGLNFCIALQGVFPPRS
jgi:microcystin-dependent protein